MIFLEDIHKKLPGRINNYLEFCCFVLAFGLASGKGLRDLLGMWGAVFLFAFLPAPKSDRVGLAKKFIQVFL